MFLISFMLVQFPSRLLLGLEWKNGPEDSIPWQHHHTLPISINYWDTTGFVCSFGNSSAYIEVQIVDFFFPFFFFKCIYFIPFCSILIVGTGSRQAAGTHYSFNL